MIAELLSLVLLEIFSPPPKPKKRRRRKPKPKGGSLC